ncbi:hypothetical protein LPTSP3_g30090 [Leptospira kobayashii]|uniref:Uncharacterized protein n=1 Tax=Leptospira kobayashii TaxID=1917830 RepID=A0ABM7UMC7_9LEPT|nr:hypothetical protein [Leptospira kobayashii]BDA80079.1 hypothetical protein LPTSP3_g30090 [Leptospira kobayashii]
MNGSIMKKSFLILIMTLATQNFLFAEAVSNKSYKKRIELLTYLRELEPIVKNFRGEDPEGNPAALNAAEGKEGFRLKKYLEAKRIYQEGLQYYFEGNYVASYQRFLECQLGVEKMLEELSQLYILRAEEMMKVAMERKNANNPLDKALLDISIEYGKGSYFRSDVMDQPREAPFSRRMYDAKEVHYVYNKYSIEKNMELGYRHLGLAKEARINALKVERNLEKHQKLQPSHRKFRIENYFGSISLSRDSKANAINIYKLKYPYDNYFLSNSQAKSEPVRDENGAYSEGQPVKVEGVTYDFSNNPYIRFDHRLQAMFDVRIPEEYRVDYADTRGRIYEVDSNNMVFLKYDQERKKALNIPAKPATPAGNTQAQ